MGMLDATRFIERLQFFNGQRLFADDLAALEGFHRELRWLHNRSLHQPGIGSGYAVYGAKGDREIRIGPGYAVDACGREIVLTEEHVEPVPPDAGDEDDKSKPAYYDLTVSYPVDEDLEEAETRAGICQPRGVVRLREAPVFCWVRLTGPKENLVVPAPYKDEISQGCKIVVAQAEVLNCKLNQPLSVAQRVSARPPQRPYIACGRADPPAWELLRPFGAKEDIGLKAYIDTTRAGFRLEPCYTARIDGLRPIASVSEHLFDVATVIDNPSANGFTIQVLLANFPSLGLPSTLTGLTSLDLTKLFADWTVEWMGVEA